MLKRVLVLLALVLLLVPLIVVHAQDAPPAVLTALAALNQKLGTNLIISNLSSWNWEQKNFPDTSMGCPQTGQTYAQVVTNGFIVQLGYNGITYDYRVSADRQIVFLCSPGGGAPPAVLTPTPFATPLPLPTSAPVVVNPVTSPGVAVCPGGMLARLAVGMQGKAITTGSVNIRATPGTGAQVAGLLLPNGVFTVTGGPSCQGNQTWWLITYTGKSNETITGWVMEGDAPTNDYWLEPVGVTVPAAAGTITAANAAQLTIKQQVKTVEPVGEGVVLPNTNALLVTGAQQLQFFSALSAQPLLTVGAISAPSTMTQSPEFFQIAAVDSHFAAVETLNSLAETMTLWHWTVTPGATAPVVSNQVGFQVPRTNSLAFTPDGKRLALGTGFTAAPHPNVSNGVWILDTATNQIVAWPLAAPVAAVAFTADGSLLAASTTENAVHLYSLATSMEIGVLSGPIAIAQGRSMLFSPNGSLLAVAADDGAIRVWDVAARTLRYTLTSPAGTYPHYLAFNPAGTLLAAVGPTQTLPSFASVWDMTTGGQVAALPAVDDSYQAVTFDTTGAQLIILGAQTWYLWGLP